MGATLVGAAFTQGASLNNATLRLLAGLALRCIDHADQHVIDMSRDTMASILGYVTLSKAAERKISRCLSKLVDAGILDRTRKPAPGRRQNFALYLTRRSPNGHSSSPMEPSTDVSTVPTTDIDGTVDKTGDSEGDQAISLNHESEIGRTRTRARTHARERPPDQNPDEGHGEPRAETGTATKRIIGAWLRNLPHRPPHRVITKVGREINSLLDEGITPDSVTAGITVWAQKGLPPRLLPEIVHETMNSVSRDDQTKAGQAAAREQAHRKDLESQAARRREQEETAAKAVPTGQRSHSVVAMLAALRRKTPASRSGPVGTHHA